MTTCETPRTPDPFVSFFILRQLSDNNANNRHSQRYRHLLRRKDTEISDDESRLLSLLVVVAETIAAFRLDPVLFSHAF